MKESLLTPTTPQPAAVQKRIVEAKEQQKERYDKKSKDLQPLTPGENVRMKLPGEKIWSPAVCTKKLSNRSYVVQAGSQTYRRNRRQIRRTAEPSFPEATAEEPETEQPAPTEGTPKPTQDLAPTPVAPTTPPVQTPQQPVPSQSPVKSQTPTKAPSSSPSVALPLASAPEAAPEAETPRYLSRGRRLKTPKHLADYHTKF